MDEAVLEMQRMPERPRGRGHLLTPRRMAAAVALALLASVSDGTFGSRETFSGTGDG